MSAAEVVLLSFAIFLSSAFHDYLSTVWAKSVAAHRAWRAALTSGLLSGLNYLEVLSVVSSVALVVPAIVGSMVGSHLGVRWPFRRRKSDYRRRHVVHEHYR